ncbi:hypothetical protein STRTUCAR8_03964, partial [Streptomyces turgidiscabies Car8]
GQRAHGGRREQHAEDVAEGHRRARVALREPRHARQSGQGVDDEGGEAATGAERGADEERGEGLPGHRHRRAGHGDGDLGGDPGERGTAEHERGVPDAGGGEQVGEDLAGAGGGDGGCHGDSARMCGRQGTSRRYPSALGPITVSARQRDRRRLGGLRTNSGCYTWYGVMPVTVVRWCGLRRHGGRAL